jgi:hypothetical protein
MRKCNDEIYQLAKDQALVKKLKKAKDLGLFTLMKLVGQAKYPSIQL